MPAFEPEARAHGKKNHASRAGEARSLYKETEPLLIYLPSYTVPSLPPSLPAFLEQAEKERQRENEIRAFRDFSLNLSSTSSGPFCSRRGAEIETGGLGGGSPIDGM